MKETVDNIDDPNAIRKKAGHELMYLANGGVGYDIAHFSEQSRKAYNSHLEKEIKSMVHIGEILLELLDYIEERIEKLDNKNP